MRLTLRTMLAYLDDILEPGDREDIGKKIDESEFATGLMHRIRDSVRRLRLGAPKLNGKGLAHDPNTVAEYLDNTLSAERVPDFEKVCLESDVHLAEVGACHQILTLVLNRADAPEIDPELRRRMYRLASQVEEPAAVGVVPPPLPGDAAIVPPPMGDAGIAPPPTSTAGVVPPPIERPAPVRPKREVPDYLRESTRRRWWPVAATIFLALLLIGVVARAIGPFDETHPFAQYIGMSPAPREVARSDRAKDENPAQEEGAKEPDPGDVDQAVPAAETGDADEKVSADAANAAAAVAPSPEEEAPVPPGDTEPADKDAGVTDPADRRPAVDNPPPKIAETDNTKDAAEMPAASQDDANAAAATPATASKTGEKEMPVAPSPDDIATTIPPRFAEGLKPVPAPTGDAATKPADDAATAAAGGGRVGRLVSDNDVLIRFNPEAGDWHRMKSLSAFTEGDRVIALPTYRPKLQLPADLMLQVAGETMVELSGVDIQGVPGIQVPYGRIIVLSVGMAGSELRMRLGNLEGLAVFDGPESVLAIEVRPQLTPGANPETTEPQVAVDFYTVSGEIRWLGADDVPHLLTAQTHAVLGPDGPKVPAEEKGIELPLPPWIAAEEIKPTEERASSFFASYLKPGPETSMILSLKELTSARQVEQRLLAARSLALLDVFEPSVDALMDSGQRPYWQIHVKSLRNAIARGPETAAKVRAAIEKRRAGEGIALYRMLWGYSLEQLRGGEAKQLVDYLNHQALDYRILAHTNLREAIGPGRGNFYYQPEDPQLKRQQGIRRWRDELESGRLLPEPDQPAEQGDSKPAPATAAGDAKGSPLAPE